MYYKFIEYYFKVINDKKFIKFGKELAHLLDIELEKNNNEVETVKNWVENIKGKCVNDKYFKVCIDSLFIHAYNHSDNGSFPSGIEFDYYGNLGKAELADILFINSFYYNRKLILKKINFNQAKKQKNNSRWDIDEKQLYLLTRLPRFKGIKGSIVPQIDFYIHSYCGNLTSYGLMNKENFIFISADNILLAKGNKKSVNLKDFRFIFDINCFNECFKKYHCFEDYLRYKCYLPFFYSVLFSENTYKFIFSFIKGYIGEIVENEIFYYKNEEANNLLKGILENIKTYGKKSNNKEILNFISRFSDSDGINIGNNEFEENNEGRGLAVVHIKIYLGMNYE